MKILIYQMMNSKVNRYYFFILFFIVLGGGIMHSCGTPPKVAAGSNIKISQPWVFSIDFQKGLYKTDMMIYGNELSGLTLIKRLDTSFRVVCMSEVGLKYFDMEFFENRDDTKVHYAADFLNRDIVLAKLANFYHLNFMVFTKKTNERYFDDKTQSSFVKEYKLRGEESRYYYDMNFGTVKSIRQEKRGKQLRIYFNTNDHLAPQKINSNQENLNMRLERIEP